MKKPKGHVAGAQRYSARLADSTKQVQMLYLGVQNHDGNPEKTKKFIEISHSLFAAPNGPIHYDHAIFLDPQGVPTLFAVAYWTAPEHYEDWSRTDPVASWWADSTKLHSDTGYFWEAFRVSKDHSETITFKRYIRGLSACPMHSIYPMDESGYWGAARDRIAASAVDTLEGESLNPIEYVERGDTRGQLITVAVPKNTCLIRSGVSWADCGKAQLKSYNANIKPKLDRGMDYLRDNPIDSGCLTLRQVEVLDADGNVAPEGYSSGMFQSLAHLEKWAHEHPTHLAIYTKALAEREKYQDALELRTYHEIFVINAETDFRYLNCHGKTGLLPVKFKP
jgi:aldoxime dehydratase